MSLCKINLRAKESFAEKLGFAYQVRLIAEHHFGSTQEFLTEKISCGHQSLCFLVMKGIKTSKREAKCFRLPSLHCKLFGLA